MHRLPHAKKGSVFAFKQEIDAWIAERARTGATAVGAEESGSSYSRPMFLALGILAFVLIAYRLIPFSGGAASIPKAPRSTGTAVAPRPVANDEAVEGYPSLSPDGERFVYRWSRSDGPGLFIKPVSGGSAERLSLGDPSKFTAASYPKWSPKGDLIAFLAHQAGDKPDTYGLYVVAAAGGAPRQLTTISGTGVCWAPDGDTLAFSDRTSTGEPLSIFAQSITSGLRTRLTMPGAGTFGDTRCSFSPEGSRLAVSRYATRYQSDVYVTSVPPPAEDPERLTSDVSGIHGIDWTPDGQSVMFGTHNGLWMVSASRSENRKPSLVVAAGIRELAFSRPRHGPARLVYHHSAHDVNIWGWHAGAPASATMQRVATSTTYDDHPAISPDGRRVAFASNRTGANEIWTAAVDGADARQLTFYNGPLVLTPRWSADGRRIAFASFVGGNWDIYTIEADGSRPTRLTWEASQDNYPSWSRDGRWLYFRSDRDGLARIWKMPAEGGAALRVTSGPASQAFESPDATKLYFVRSTDVPGLWEMSLDRHDERFVLANVKEGFWDVAAHGVAFLVADPRISPAGPTIRFFDFHSKSVSTLAVVPRAVEQVNPGFAVSRDARTVVWCQTDRQQSDVMLIDPWPP